MANCFVVFYWLHGKFVDWVISLMWVSRRIYTGGIPEELSVYAHTMSRPGSGPDSSQHLKLRFAEGIQLCCFDFFPNSALRNRGCGLSMDVAYTRTFMVKKKTMQCILWPVPTAYDLGRSNKTYSAFWQFFIRGRNRQFHANFPPYWIEKEQLRDWALTKLVTSTRYLCSRV